MPRIRTSLYRLVPHTRRPRAILIGDEIFAKVGAYVLGNVADLGDRCRRHRNLVTVFNVPYPLLLGIFVGCSIWCRSWVQPSPVSLSAAVALTVSLPVCIATIVFFVAFRLGEDYLLVPRSSAGP